MSRLLSGFLLAVLAAGAAQAQSGGGLILLPGDSQLSCLNRTDDSKRPTYPEREAQLKEGGTVRVSLTFTRADAPPTVETTFSEGGETFINAVMAFAKGYRLPCVAPGAPPVAATQEFQFVPDDGRKVIFSGLRDHPKATQAINCVTGTQRKPDYPKSVSEQPLEGTVLVAMKFVDGTTPPQTKVFYDGGSSRLATAVLAAVEQYRMPCLAVGDVPLTAMQAFAFVMDGSKRYTLKDVQLKQFLAAVDGLDKTPVRFDFATMSCPFDVQVRLFQPHAANEVGEVERADPNRREFIEWLRGVSLKLPPEAARRVIGQTIRVSVPCGVVDLS